MNPIPRRDAETLRQAQRKPSTRPGKCSLRALHTLHQRPESSPLVELVLLSLRLSLRLCVSAGKTRLVWLRLQQVKPGSVALRLSIHVEFGLGERQGADLVAQNRVARQAAGGAELP